MSPTPPHTILNILVITAEGPPPPPNLGDGSAARQPPASSHHSTYHDVYAASTNLETHEAPLIVRSKLCSLCVWRGAAPHTRRLSPFFAGSFLVDKAAGEVYRSLEDTAVIGTYSNAFGLRLDGETAEVAARLNSQGPAFAMAPQFEGGTGDSLSFVNPLIELDTQIKPRTSIKVVDEPGGQAKSGYQGTNPDWLDSQHSALTVEPWFFDKGTMTPHGAVKKLAKGAQGQFLVRRSLTSVFSSSTRRSLHESLDHWPD